MVERWQDLFCGLPPPPVRFRLKHPPHPFLGGVEAVRRTCPQLLAPVPDL